MKNILFVFGTRPEAIKMAPLIIELNRHPGLFHVKVCLTGQHREMLDQVVTFFEIKPDYDLQLMRDNQTLFSLTANCLLSLESVFDDANPDVVIVQGDTTSAFVGALAAYYKKIKVAHIEAGLRSFNKYSPFPEEMNRILAGNLADYHFAPTSSSGRNLEKEGIAENVFVVGNTVIDALHLGLQLIRKKGEEHYSAPFDFLKDEKVLLVTGHRRESFGEPFLNICRALESIAEKYPEVSIVYPVHLNPNVKEPVEKMLQGIRNIHLIDPLDYPHMIWLLNRSYIVLTDSGGLQEEAPGLGKPVLVMRDVTERQEGVDAGTALLVGTDTGTIIREVSKLLTDKAHYQKMSQAVNPYGEGNSSQKIREILAQ